jgi:hypothetical protein
MSRTVTITTVALLAALVPAAPAAAAQKAPSCARAKSKTIAQNSSVRVYQVGTGEAKTLSACRRSTGRRVQLARAFDDGFAASATFGDVRLSGKFVAWSSTATDTSCKADCPAGYEPTTRAIDVYDVGRRKGRTVAGYPFNGALVLSRYGAVAWAARESNAGPVDVHASVRAGDDRVLDSGNIDPDSLAIEITIISWTRDGEEHFARLR